MAQVADRVAGKSANRSSPRPESLIRVVLFLLVACPWLWVATGLSAGEPIDRAEEYWPVVSKLLDESDRSKAEVAEFIQAMGEKQAEIVPAFLRILKNKKASIRIVALEFLTRLEPKTAETAVEVVNLASDPDPGVRKKCIEAIGRFGKCGKVGLKVLVAALEDPATRMEALNSLTSLGAEAAPVAKDVLRHIDSDDYKTRGQALIVLGRSEVGGKEVLAGLIAALKKEKDPILTWVIISNLGNLGLEAEPALSLIETFLGSENDTVRSFAKEAIQKIKEAKTKSQDF